MATEQSQQRTPDRASPGGPVEITMTDLEASEAPIPENGVDAAGTPGGGTAAGGLAGTNINDGSPNNGDLDDALGSGVYDDDVDREEVEEERLLRRMKETL